MKATRWEVRIRELLATLIYVLGFWAPWERYTGLSLGGSTVWTAVASMLFRQHWMGFSASSRALLIASTTAAILAALLRWWAGSYPQPGLTTTAEAAGTPLRAAGPFRFIREPAAIGVWLHTAALALLMPPSGALVALLLMVVLELRLIGYGEAVATTRGGPAYAAYCSLVPRLMPASFRPRVAASGLRGSWLAGLLSAVLFIGTAVAFVVQGDTYNGTFILRWVLVAFGLQLIANAAQAPGRRTPIA